MDPLRRKVKQWQMRIRRRGQSKRDVRNVDTFAGYVTPNPQLQLAGTAKRSDGHITQKEMLKLNMAQIAAIDKEHMAQIQSYYGIH